MSCAGPDDFRRAMRLMPASVTIVAAGAAPHRSGLTATAVCSLSAEPPQILACLNARSGTCRRIREGGLFSVNVLDQGHRALAEHFAGAGGASGEERFRFGDWREGPRGAPVLADCVVSLECVLVDAIPAATHFIMIGQVLDLKAAGPAGALIYRDGQFGTWMALDA